jgi:KaiC/GvpD/RAD55 family RecA-like ATPase
MSAFIADRKDYDMASPHLVRKDLSPFGAALLEAIDDYYHRDADADSIDLELLRQRLDRRFKDIPKHQDKMRSYMEQVLSFDGSKVNVIAEVIENQRADVSTALVDALLAHDERLIEELLVEYQRLTDASALDLGVEEEYQGLSIHQLEEMLDSDGEWELAPKILGEKVKKLRPGHSVIMAARPERGKTLFATHINAGMLMQGAKTLYIGNEDPVPDLILRLLSNLTGMDEEQMRARKDEVMELAESRGYDNCVFAGLSPGSLYEVEALIRRHEPDVVIVDQMRNLKAKTENNTQRLEVVAQELRNMARRHNCLMISMTQVGDSGRNKLVLNDGDIDGSNTGIPGACDVIIMIGSNDEYELRDWRTVTLAKNKRGGDHSNFVVAVDRKLSRVISHA